MRSPVALATLLLAFAAAPVSAAAPSWCDAVPLPNAGQCQVLQVRAPRGTLRLAVAADDQGREHGLMGVRTVPVAQGMIFVFPDAGDQHRYFWMKNTIAPLDMIFVRVDGTISSIAANVPATAPGTPDSRVARRDGIGRYVIELAAGGAARAGLAPGIRLWVPPIASQ